MPAIARHTPSIVGAMTTLLIVVGCDQGNRESSAGGDVARDTSTVSGAPVAAQPIQPGTVDLDDAEDRIESALRADSALGAFRLGIRIDNQIRMQ